MAIEWTDKLSVGNDDIDNDHKHLIKLINAYELVVAQKNLKLLETAFASLEAYAIEHFEREEKIMDAVHFPQRGAHRDEHRKLMDLVQQKHQQIQQQDRVSIDDLSKFLHDWLIDHVIKEDMQIKSYLMGGRKD